MKWVQIGWILVCASTTCLGSEMTSSSLPSWTWLMGFWFSGLGLTLLGSNFNQSVRWVFRLLITTIGLSLVWYGRPYWGQVLATDWAQESSDIGILPVTIGALVFLSMWLWARYNSVNKWRTAPLIQLTVWLCALSCLVLFGQQKGLKLDWWDQGLTGFLLITWMVDWIMTASSFRDWSKEKASATMLATIFFSRWNPIASLFDWLEGLFGIDIQGTWIIQYVRSLLEPLVALLLFIGWCSTSMVVIHPTESGVRTVFGVPQNTVLESGFHWKLPLPFGAIHRVSTHRIEQLSIGHSEELEELDGEGEPESILWANQHVSEEFLLLLGDGHDVISADGVLEYRISNVHDYLFESQNPEEVLESVVYQVLMDQTASRTLEEALSENLTELAQTVTNDIQERMAKYRLGIEPIVFTFTALHPPVSVAKDYQEVVSAQIDVLTKKYRAEQYRLQSLPKARAEKVTGIELAKQDAAHLLASARGESASFEGLRQTVRQAQDLYRFRVRQDNLQKIITGKSVIILDHRLEQEGATLWIEP